MTEEDARRYLFRLYASGKDGTAGAAGRFGVGFWSLLRLEPRAIHIRSCAVDGPGWETAIVPGKEPVLRGWPQAVPGTEIEIHTEALGSAADVSARVRDAAWRDGRYLRQRGRPRTALRIDVGGEPVGEEPRLPPPCATFRRGRVRGVVGLGQEARVDLFSRGLRVRTAASLQDLLLASPSDEGAPAGGLVPQVILECDDLVPLLARGDVREDRALVRAVRLAEKELERLLRRQLRAARPPSLARRARALARSRAVRALVLAGVVVALLRLVSATGGGRAPSLPASLAVAAALPPEAPAGRAETVPLTAYRDLGDRYAGPTAEASDDAAGAVDISYEPPTATPLFVALRLDPLSGPAAAVSEERGLTPAGCDDGDCLEIRLAAAGGGRLRLPLPSGHVLARSPSADVPAWAGTDGLPLVTPLGREISYATSPGRDPTPWPVRTDAVPASLEKLAAPLRGLSPEAMGREALATVARLVRYERSEETARRHAEATAAGIGFVERTLAVGAGDCDVQNGLLAALLLAAGGKARLAIGYVGHDGRVLPGLHAWTELRDASGDVLVLDASAGPVHPLPLVAGAPVSLAAAGAEAPGGAAAPGDAGSLDAPAAPVADSGTDTRAATTAAAAAALTALLVTAILVSRRTRRTVDLVDRPDVARILRGALEHPDAFAGARAVEHQPIVPLHGGRVATLAEARAAARAHDLYAAAAPEGLTSSATRRGATVLDTASPEGRVVAEALGAADLEVWEARLARARASALTEAADATLRAAGEDVQLLLAEDDGADVEDLQAMDVGRIARGRPARIVTVSPRHPAVERADALLPRSRGAAVAAMLDVVRPALGIPEPRWRRLLAPLSLEASYHSG